MKEEPEKPAYFAIKEYYERCLEEHGIDPLGVDWPTEESMYSRFDVMHGIVGPGEKSRILDIGCGVGFYLDFLEATGRRDEVDYSGVDISPKMIEEAKLRFPGEEFEARDIISDPLPEGEYDYAIMNGVLTVSEEVNNEAMTNFMESIVKSAFRSVKRGLAFNVMSKQVDWEKDRLYHLSFDEVASFLSREVSRHFVIRHDYGLWEYTIYVYHDAVSKGAGEKKFIPSAG